MKSTRNVQANIRNMCSRYDDTCVPDDEGINNFAALIVRLDNPLLVEIINEFTLTAKMLREK